MKEGVKVKKIKGDPFGKVGIIRSVYLIKGPVNLTEEPRGLKDRPYTKGFVVEAEDGSTFQGMEDEFELIE